MIFYLEKFVHFVHFCFHDFELLLQALYLLVLHLDLKVLEVSPLGQDLHGLDVLDGSELLSVVFVSAQGVKIYLLAKTLVLVLHDLQDGVDLLAVQDLLVIHTRD